MFREHTINTGLRIQAHAYTEPFKLAFQKPGDASKLLSFRGERSYVYLSSKPARPLEQSHLMASQRREGRRDARLERPMD